MAVALSAESGASSCAHTTGDGCCPRASRRGRSGALPPPLPGVQQGERSHKQMQPSAPADSSKLPPAEADRAVTAAPPCASLSTRTVRTWSAGPAKARRHCRAKRSVREKQVAVCLKLRNMQAPAGCIGQQALVSRRPLPHLGFQEQLLPRHRCWIASLLLLQLAALCKHLCRVRLPQPVLLCHASPAAAHAFCSCQFWRPQVAQDKR